MPRVDRPDPWDGAQQLGCSFDPDFARTPFNQSCGPGEYSTTIPDPAQPHERLVSEFRSMLEVLARLRALRSRIYGESPDEVAPLGTQPPLTLNYVLHELPAEVARLRLEIIKEIDSLNEDLFT